jgi:hypothetical protein
MASSAVANLRAPPEPDLAEGGVAGRMSETVVEHLKLSTSMTTTARG